ncbi:uncharacterized protein BKA78DRAFT_347744 [Phyllosticta capitalensis]|uniref:uncharacterized protein n=1 Tax=Phyllosticta capitalensis TaxID=121624 RepID=UPI00312E5C16
MTTYDSERAKVRLFEDIEFHMYARIDEYAELLEEERDYVIQEIDQITPEVHRFSLEVCQVIVNDIESCLRQALVLDPGLRNVRGKYLRRKMRGICREVRARAAMEQSRAEGVRIF